MSRLTSHNRWNWASFDDRDHLGDPSRPLRERLVVDAARHGIELPAGPIFLLTHLRYLGYCFNPVSFFYCFDRAEQLQVVLAEVSNTFGGSHNYWLRPDPASRTFRAAATKSLYVSPFMPVDLEYTFAFTPPAGSLVAHMETSQAGSVGFDATLSLERRPWNAAEIRRALVRYPAMTARVMAGIHWEALKLWWKGVPVVPRVTADGVGERAAQTRRDRPVRGGSEEHADAVGEDGVSLGPRRRDRRNADRGVPGPHVPVRGAWRVGCDPDGPRRAVLSAGADGQRHRPRRVLHGRRLDDARSGAPGAADAAQPAGARRAESPDRRAAPAGGRPRPPPPGQLPGREPPAYPSALRPWQRLLPPLSRRRTAHVFVRLLRVSR